MNNIRYVVRRQKSIFETRRYAPPYIPTIYSCFETWRSVSFETREDEAIYRRAADACYAPSLLALYAALGKQADSFNILVDGVKMVGSVKTQRFNQSMMGGGTTTTVIECQARIAGSSPKTEVYLAYR